VKGLIELGDISSLVGMGKIEWKKFLETKKEGAEINKIRRYSRLVLRLGFPLTYKEFIGELSKRTGELLKLMPRGRSTKNR